MSKQDKEIDAYIQNRLPALRLALKEMETKNVRTLRREFAQLGYRIKKSHQRINLNNKGGFMLIEVRRNIAVDGWDYDLTVDRLKEILIGLKGIPYNNIL